MLTKKMFSVFVALSMAVVLSGCSGASSLNIREKVTSRSYDKVSVQIDEKALAEYRDYDKPIRESVEFLLIGGPLTFSFFDSPKYGEEYGDGEVLIVKTRVISVDHGYGSKEAKIQVVADFFDSGGESLGSVQVEGKSNLKLSGSFDEAILHAKLKMQGYILQQFYN